MRRGSSVFRPLHLESEISDHPVRDFQGKGLLK